MIPEWRIVKEFVRRHEAVEMKALEGCPHEDISYHRGRLHAFRAVLNLESPSSQVDEMVSMGYQDVSLD